MDIRQFLKWKTYLITEVRNTIQSKELRSESWSTSTAQWEDRICSCWQFKSSSYPAV